MSFTTAEWCLSRNRQCILRALCCIFFFQAEDGIRYHCVTGVQTCALPISWVESVETAKFAGRTPRRQREVPLPVILECARKPHRIQGRYINSSMNERATSGGDRKSVV